MIKFRAWDKGNEIYLYDVQDAYDTLSGNVKYDDGEYADYDEDCFGGFLDNERYDVEQFIGLTDLNGKKIYDGDIIRSSYKYAQPKISQVIIENGNSYILGEDLATGNEMLVSDHIGEIEVIGNVHENSELLGLEAKK
ncbi:Phage protein [Lactiplantibacillus plantarum]|nr:Phage protein [Lactiplantibacillus plantarum]